MANKHPTPPPPRVRRGDHPHFEQAGMTLVDQYNLSSIVREMRNKGRSYREIADYLNNTKGVIPNDYKISYNSISRYCRDHGLNGDVSDNVDEAVNIYREQTRSLRDVNTALDIITVQLDDMAKKKVSVKPSDLNQLINSLDKMTLRRQTLAMSIGDLQERVYKYEIIPKVLNKVMARVSVEISPEAYEQLKQDLRDDPVICEALREIAPSKM